MLVSRESFQMTELSLINKFQQTEAKYTNNYRLTKENEVTGEEEACCLAPVNQLNFCHRQYFVVCGNVRNSIDQDINKNSIDQDINK